MEREIVWLHGQVHTPPFSRAARIEAGYLLRCLQEGETLSMPDSRPMPSIGARCGELRIDDGRVAWRIVYRTDPDAIIILDVFKKSTPQTPRRIIEQCRARLRAYDQQQ